MNHAGTVCQRYIAVACHEERFLVLLCRAVICTLVQRLVLFVLQILSLICLQHLIGRLIFCGQLSKDCVQQGLCHVVHIAVRSFYFCVVLIRIYAETDVGGQCPWRCGPCQNVGVLVFYFKADNGGALFYILVSLGYFLGGQRRAAARTVGNDLEPFVEKSLVPDLLQRPPLGLDEIIMVGDVWIFHICPEAYCAGEVLPHALVLPDTLLTFVDERLQAVLLDLVLAVQAKSFLHLQLHRQTVGIPTRFSGHHVSLHGAVSGDHVLDDTGQHVTDVGLAVGCRRPVVEGVGLTLFAVLHTLFKNLIVFPEFLDLFLAVDEIQVC